jgi:hypothetical protein
VDLSRKAQVETMGLVIIVFLLVIAGVFALIFMTGSEETKHEDLFLSMKASNLANSLTFMTIGSSEFGLRTIDCCQGFDTLACEEIEAAASSGLDLLDESASVVIECVNNQNVTFGGCSSGINSEKIVLSSRDGFFVRICRK